MLGNNNKELCSIYDAEQGIIENSECWQLLQRFPKGGMPDQANYIFAGSLEEPINPFLISELVDEEGLKLEGDAFVLAVGKELSKDGRTHGILGDKNDIISLSKSPIWLIWQKHYDDDNRAAFEADYLAVKAIFPALPEYNESITFEQAANFLLAGMKTL